MIPLDTLITNCLNTEYGIKVATLTSLPLGADMNASVYKAQAQDNTAYFIKLKQGHHHDLSTKIVEFLQHAGIQQIIPPIKTVHDLPSHHLEDYTLIVYPFVKGADGFCRDLTDTQWLQLGKTLRQIHALDVPQSIQKQCRHETYSPLWRNIVRTLYTHIDEHQSADKIALQLSTLLKEKRQTIYRLLDRAESLCQKLQNQPPQFVLCHSDIHGGNVLLDEDNTLYIVDWDEPTMAPSARDLMFIGAGVANVWNKPHEEKLFYKGYGKTEVNMTAIAYFRHERILEDIAIYGQELLLTASGGQNRQEMYQHFAAMFDPRGVVDIALKSDSLKS